MIKSIRDAYSELEKILSGGDVRGALAFLNSLGKHRFTALFVFDDELLRNVFVYDRENPDLEALPDIIPVEASYCVFVRDTCRTFRVENSVVDGRVDGHPKQAVVQSYCGVPILLPDGSLYGSICHFDLDAIPFEEAQVDLLERVAAMLQTGKYKIENSNS